jgi:hypothetical protein
MSISSIASEITHVSALKNIPKNVEQTLNFHFLSSFTLHDILKSCLNYLFAFLSSVSQFSNKQSIIISRQFVTSPNIISQLNKQ